MRAVAVLAIVTLVTVVGSPLVAEDDVGKTLYDKKCAMCHGKDGVAKKMAAGSANLNDPEYQKASTLEEIEKIIAEGKGKMPKYGTKLSGEEIEAIATYVKKL